MGSLIRRHDPRPTHQGTIGEIVNVQHLEPIGSWHFAHSYVRGSWRNEAESTFMLLAKCCHDVDLIRYIVGRRCNKLSSFGSLQLFRPVRVSSLLWAP